jgi:hypothetical protein
MHFQHVGKPCLGPLLLHAVLLWWPLYAYHTDLPNPNVSLYLYWLHLLPVLPVLLISWCHCCLCSDVELYAEKVRRAISTAAVLLDNDWARLNDCAGEGGTGARGVAGLGGDLQAQQGVGLFCEGMSNS